MRSDSSGARSERAISMYAIYYRCANSEGVRKAGAGWRKCQLRMWSQVKISSLGHIQEGLWDTNHIEEYLP